jgi:signal transduction histidine kinase/DNA-binding response OmpR family regulator
MSFPLLSVVVASQADVVTARQRARHIAELVGFEAQDQVRIATAVSEIVRNAFRYGGGGRVSFAVEGESAPQLLQIVIRDSGGGIPNLPEVLAGHYRSDTGLGIGIAGSRRLMDQFAIDAPPKGGTVVTMGKLMPATAPVVNAARVPAIAAALSAAQPQDALAETLQQNRDLLRALDDLRRRQDELHRLNRELEDTNRGVVALYAELDERADHLRRADEMKSKFLSNMSHEFRTPLNSILALTRLLLERSDGELTPEQETQVSLVQKAAGDLSELVNDLLDLAKVDAGKTVVRAADFEVVNLFGALRGMLRPLLVGNHVDLTFDVDGDIPTLHTDEAKISQVLRNFISNALKFTEQGAVRVTARYDADERTVVFAVSDTGIGIAPEDHDRIFQEFVQIENRAQRRVRGTGLGLPLSRRLAQLLGGRLLVTSTPGKGSTFSMIVPAVFEARPSAQDTTAAAQLDPDRLPVLIVEDAVEERVIYERLLRDSPFQPLLARTVREAHLWLEQLRPAAIILDVKLHGQDAWPYLAELRRDDATRDTPIILVSAMDERRKGLALGADDYLVKPLRREALLERLTALVQRPQPDTVLIVDDDPAARYLLRHHVAQFGFAVREAASGAEALRITAEHCPAAILLDLTMPDMSGPETLGRLRADARTRRVPVLIATSADPSQALAELGDSPPPVLSKQHLAGADATQRLRRALTELGLRLPAIEGGRHGG